MKWVVFQYTIVIGHGSHYNGLEFSELDVLRRKSRMNTFSLLLPPLVRSPLSKGKCTPASIDV